MAYSPKNWGLGDAITDTDLNRIETGIDEVDAAAAAAFTANGIDAAWVAKTSGVTNAFTAASGWTISSQSLSIYGNVVSFSVTVSRTGSTITSDETTGTITGGQIATLTAAYRPSTTRYVEARWNGRMGQGTVGSDGAVVALSTLPNVALASSNSAIVSGTYVL